MAMPRVLGTPVVYRVSGGGAAGLRLAFVVVVTNADAPNSSQGAVATLIVLGEGAEQNTRVAGAVRQQVAFDNLGALAIGRWTMPP